MPILPPPLVSSPSTHYLNCLGACSRQLVYTVFILTAAFQCQLNSKCWFPTEALIAFLCNTTLILINIAKPSWNTYCLSRTADSKALMPIDGDVSSLTKKKIVNRGCRTKLLNCDIELFCIIFYLIVFIYFQSYFLLIAHYGIQYEVSVISNSCCATITGENCNFNWQVITIIIA